jgi:cytidine deaminase
LNDWKDYEQELIRRAIDVRNRAYAPYSNYKVGAAIISQSGQFHCGCNVENASFGLTVCAERNAVAAMVSAGFSEVLAIAVALSGHGSPCGACRQVLTEFGSNFPVLLIDVNKPDFIQRLTIEALLPSAFRLPDVQ